jgi:hypothetical protein
LILAKLVKFPIQSDPWRSHFLRRELRCLGFWDIAGPFSVGGEFARIGQRRGSRLEPRTKAAVGISGEAKNLPEEGRFYWTFFGGGGTRFLLGVLAKTGHWTWFLVVELWWIAGESWELDAQFSGSQNIPPLKVGKVSNINLVDGRAS